MSRKEFDQKFKFYTKSVNFKNLVDLYAISKVLSNRGKEFKCLKAFAVKLDKDMENSIDECNLASMKEKQIFVTKFISCFADEIAQKTGLATDFCDISYTYDKYTDFLSSIMPGVSVHDLVLEANNLTLNDTDDYDTGDIDVVADKEINYLYTIIQECDGCTRNFKNCKTKQDCIIIEFGKIIVGEKKLKSSFQNGCAALTIKKCAQNFEQKKHDLYSMVDHFSKEKRRSTI